MSTQLSIFAIEMNCLRRVVAAPSVTHAAKLLEVSAYILRTHGEVSRSDSEEELALSDAGAVFGRAEGMDEWVQVASSKRSRMLPNRGGYRPGGGKPREAETLAKRRCARLCDAHNDALEKLGGISWMRARIRTADARGAVAMAKPVLGKNEDTTIRSFRLCDEDYDKYVELGAAKWLRLEIETASPQLLAAHAGSQAFCHGKKHNSHAFDNALLTDAFEDGWVQASEVMSGSLSMQSATTLDPRNCRE